MHSMRSRADGVSRHSGVALALLLVTNCSLGQRNICSIEQDRQWPVLTIDGVWSGGQQWAEWRRGNWLVGARGETFIGWSNAWSLTIRSNSVLSGSARLLVRQVL